MASENRIMNIDELTKLPKQQLIDLLLNKKNKSIPQLRKSVKQMVQDYEENIIEIGKLKPIPTPRSQIIKIEGVNKKKHPIYNLYASSVDGKLIYIGKRILMTSTLEKNGYLRCSARKFGQVGQKRYCAHRFIWECCNGLIPEGKEIDHMNDIRDDNRLCNLQLLTVQQNKKKAAEKRDYSFHKYNYQNKKRVRAISCITNEVVIFVSMSAAVKSLGIDAGTTRNVSEQHYGCKKGKSKINSQSYDSNTRTKKKIQKSLIGKISVRTKIE